MATREELINLAVDEEVMQDYAMDNMQLRHNNITLTKRFNKALEEVDRLNAELDALKASKVQAPLQDPFEDEAPDAS